MKDQMNLTSDRTRDVWVNADSEMPELIRPSCQSCHRDASRPVSGCRHETNIFWSISPSPLLVKFGDDYEIANGIIEYRSTDGKGGVFWRSAWRGLRSMPYVEGTLWRSLP